MNRSTETRRGSSPTSSGCARASQAQPRGRAQEPRRSPIDIVKYKLKISIEGSSEQVVEPLQRLSLNDVRETEASEGL